MSWILSKLLGQPRVQSLDANNERYWTSAGSAGGYSSAGMYVGPQNALKISTFWACLGLLADTVAGLPLGVFQRLPDGGKRRAVNNPLYPVLHDQPNENQTSFEFRQQMMMYVLTRGDAIATIESGPRGFVDQLIPVHPDALRMENLKNGRMLYHVTTPNGVKTYNQENIFHLRGLTLNGKTGLSVLEYGAESMGMSLAAERYGARFFKNNSAPSGRLTTPHKITKELAEQLKEEWEAAHTGENQHRIAVAQMGLEFKPVGLTNEEAQFMGLREFQAEDICRWLRVPPWMVGLTSKSTSWGTGIEQMGIAFVTYTLMSWLKRWEQSISRDLIIATDRYFAEFNVDGLLRGDSASRTAFYTAGIQSGWMSPNEVREKENMNPRPGGDVYLTPLNMQPSNEQAAASEGHYQLLAREAAARVVRKEIAALSKAAEKFDKPEDWMRFVRNFYYNHAQFIELSLVVGRDQAVAYVTTQVEKMILHGPQLLDEFLEPSIEQLLNIMEIKTDESVPAHT